MKVSLSPAEVREIDARAAKRGALNGRTLIGGAGNGTGFAGEKAFAKLFPQAHHADTRDFDFVLGSKKVEIKSRASDAQPQPFWDCKVPAYSANQQGCDVYVFTCVRKDLSEVIFLGCISKADFFKKARLVPAGTQAPSGGMLHVDHYVVLVSDLSPVRPA